MWKVFEESGEMRSQLEITFEDGTRSEKPPASSLVTLFLQAAPFSLL
ncbi:mCG124340 [Mus musculus]|nr:mCG124340 [Mus musculus]